ncbi:sulfurtransferase TusA family protein [Cohnella luojiensis]|uniref:Sulfurtransferase TusA family protein n=1 Tax=Cohnella luojiensis TaxID=652876 RepID=A0A4Y8LQE8_9BACL|nr:sulfurtransferase TusA family protein [Cohnella luojiensis]TFE23534.1 sulfurtransferase TusA family protein [Cohnella luojiensis]
MKIDVHVDTKGLACPMPLVKGKKALDKMLPGQIMELVSTDKGALNDFKAWVKQSKNEWISHQESNGVHTFLIRKG